MSKKWSIFDAMGVVYEVGDDVRELLVPFIQRQNKRMSQLLVEKAYIEASLGEISSKDFWNRLGLGDHYPEIETLYLNYFLKIDPEFVPIAQKFKKKLLFGVAFQRCEGMVPLFEI
ncbi:MAG: hypothetical protein JW891_08535 [Candidatus Lokiarchaeota archaeon]|nr:hypothetical protein [Candidatus Lokiarchaeota archaeon]